MKRTAWTIVGLSLLLLVGCSRGVGQAPPPLPPAAPEPQGVPVMDATTTATIYLRGLPQEMISLEDDQGQTWLVVSSGLENVGLGTHVLLEGGAGRPAASGSGQVVRPECGEGALH